MSGQITPTPWKVGRTLSTPQTRKWSNAEWVTNDIHEGKLVFAFFKSTDGGRSRELVAECRDLSNAAYIVKACNNHEALVAALDRMMNHFERSVAALPEWGVGREIVTEAQAALAAVGEK